MPVFIVRPGDHLAKIAARFGFRDHHTVWDHPDNAPLRAQRSNPNVLLPGDQVVIPEHEQKSVTAATGKRHRFVAEQSRLVLRLVLRRPDGSNHADLACTLELDGTQTSLVTDNAGMIERPLRPDTRFAELRAGDVVRRLSIGDLHPVDSESGLRSRLANLGYLLEEPGRDEREALRSAVEEFQCDVGLKVTGEVDAQTQARLLESHGC